MATFKNFEDMELWQKSMALTIQIYHETNRAIFSKDYELIRQIRRTSISIPSNIAEGFERDGNKEFINFLYIAKGSCGELRCQLYLAGRLGYIEPNRFQELLNFALEISRSLNKLIRYLQESEFKGKKYK